MRLASRPKRSTLPGAAASVSSICFAFLAANNLVLVLDLVVWPAPEVDLRLPRLVLALAAAASLIWGFVWDAAEDDR